MLGTFLMGTAEMIAAGIVDMVAEDLQVSIALAGQLVTAFSLAFAIGTPIVVTLAAGLDRKKVIMISLTVFILGSLLSAWSPSFSFLLFTRVILGISAGVFSVLALSMAANLVPREQMGNAIGTVAMGFGAALVLGLPLGIMLGQWIGWRAIFLSLAALSIIMGIFLIRFLPPIAGEAKNPIKDQLSIFKNRKVVTGLFIFLFAITGYSTVYTYIVPFFQDVVGIHPSVISWAMLFIGIFATLGTRFGGYAADRWGIAKTVLVSLLLHAAALLILPVGTSWIVIVFLLCAVWVSASNTTIPAMQSFFVQQAPNSSELALSVSSSAAHIGLAIGAGLGGVFINIDGSVQYHPLFGAGIVLIGFLFAAITFFKPKAAASPQGEKALE